MKTKKIFIAMMSAAILLSGCSSATNKPTENTVEEKAIPVTVQQVKTGEISTNFRYAGTVKTNKEVMVTGKVAGKVEEVFFQVGDSVKKDDILFTVDDKDIEDSIQNLEIQLKTSQIAVDIAQKALESSKGSQLEQQINQAETALKTAEIQYNNAKKTWEDTQALYEAGSASKQQYDQAKSGYDTAKISYESAQQSYALLVNKTSKENIERAEDQLNQALASKENLVFQLKKAKDSLADTDVKAPIDGVISSRGIEEGEMVGGSSVPFIIVQMNPAIFTVNVTEQMLGAIKEGDSVNVAIGALGDKEFHGDIRSIAPIADARTATYPVEIEIDNPNNEMKAGMFGEVEFVTNKKENIIVVPREAVLENKEETYVFIAIGDGTAQKKKVETGTDNGQEIEILQGLAVDDQLIIKGQDYVADGGKIQIVEQ